MKKYIHNIILFAVIIIAVVIVFSSMDLKYNNAVTQVKGKQENIAPVQRLNEMIREGKAKTNFTNVTLFDVQNVPFSKSDISANIKTATNLKIDRVKLTGLLNNNMEYITLSLPLDSKRNIEFELKKVQLLADGFKVTAGGSNTVQNIKQGIYYRGIVKGEENSVVAISVFENLVMGIFTCDAGTYNLGPVSDNSNNTNYILYNEKDLLVRNNFKCDVDGRDIHFYKTGKNVAPENNGDAITARLPVKIYIEADYQLYLDKGSDITATSNWITGYYNSVSAIYQNEYIPVQISQISVWNTADPYRNLPGSIEYLYAFGVNKQDNFNGDLAQFLTSRQAGYGGIAWIGTLCTNFNTQDSSGRFSFCDIDPVYYSFPTYSWTVMVSTHELGHNFGSMHTHACWWPIRSGVIGAIDSCYFAEGNCFTGTKASVGTIMSYCHLQEPNGGSIDPRLGFGSMPGDTIRLRYNQCTKFGTVINSSELPTNFALLQNYPNPFNPSTTIRIAIPEDAVITLKVYDISGREVATMINNENYSAGFLNYIFNSSIYNLSSGVYFYKVVAVDQSSKTLKFTEVKRMILLK